MDELVERFNHYLDESIVGLNYIKPINTDHLERLQQRILTLQDIKLKFNRIVKKVKDDSDTGSKG